MLAEFEDAADAADAVRTDYTFSDLPHLRCVTVSVDLFRPDIAEQIIFEQTEAPVTPTKCHGDQADINDAFSNISLGNVGISPGAVGFTPGILANRAGVPYAPSNYHAPTLLSFAPGNLPGMYMAPVISPIQQAYTPAITTPVTPGQAKTPFHSLGAYSQGAFPLHSFESSLRFHQSQCASPLGQYNPKFLEQVDETGDYSRTGSRRPYLPRAQHLRSRLRSSPANSHNHVDIAKIRQGIDVRTTVGLLSFENKKYG